MSSGSFARTWTAFTRWWQESAIETGALTTTCRLVRNLWDFARDSTAEQRQRRYGDMEYDWEHRVDTTSGTVGWRVRLLGLFHSPYQPTDPALFCEMMASLAIEFEQFSFLDLGSGKGRTLLMASDYPFRRIVGVELVPELHRVAQENLARYRSARQKCFRLEAICRDAADFPFPIEPLVIYLFDPLPRSGLKRVVAELEASLRAHPREVFVLYHNPLLERTLRESTALARRDCGSPQYCLYASTQAGG